MNERCPGQLGLRVPIICLLIGLARSSICPADRVNTTHDVTSATNGHVTIQQGIFQQIPCTTFRQGESVAVIIWYQGNSDTDPERLKLISSDDDDVEVNEKYALTSYNGLVIKNITKLDEGSYVCVVVPYASINRHVVVDVHVIEGMFQAVKADVKTTSSLAQSVRNRISCPCDTTSSSTVYWSQGTGVTSETDILCTRFADGTVLQFQGGGDFGVAANGSLTLNSLQHIRETARFWCHVFKPDGSLINCYVDARILKDEQLSNKALQASTDSFYILKGEYQTLPCTNRPISEQTCEVQWFKAVSSTTDLLLNYTAWTDVTYANDRFDLGHDFALVIKSADEENGGVYICRTKSESQQMEVRVIGDTFPLDKGNISRVEEITFEAGQKYTLECMIGLSLSTAMSRTAFWSFGQKDAINTTVIGTFKLLDSFVSTGILERNSCYNITVDGALQLTGCLIDSDVRYWCHVFVDGVLYRYYVDLVVQDSSKSFPSPVAIIIPPAILIIVCLVAVFCWKRRRVEMNHPNYVMVDVEDPSKAELIGVVRDDVMKRVERVPITPWAREDTSCYARIGDVYTPLQLFINHKSANCSIRYQLESEAQIFDDGITQFKCNQVVLEGRAGSGKTTLLHKLAFDMYTGRAEAGQVRVVFVLAADLLLQHGNLGKAVFQQLGQPENTKISPRSINSFCQKHFRHVAILIDDCKEVGPVKEAIRKQGLWGAYVVMTTRQIRETDYTFEFNFRHVTVSGFKPTSAQSYIKCIIDDSERSAELVGYLDEHILPPDVESLPLNLSALCELSLWTNGDVFRRRLRTSELFCSLVRCLFDGAAHKTRRQSKTLSSSSDQTMASHQPTQDKRCDGSGQTMEGYQLTQDQQELLVNLGKTVLPRVLENHCTICELFRKDFDQFVENKNNAFDEGVTIGLLREQVGGTASQTEQKAYFVLEILQDLCVGISMARTDKELTSCLDKMLHSGTTFAKVLLFAGLPSYTAYPSIMEAITKTIKEIRGNLSSLKPLLGKLIDPRERNTVLKLTQKYMQLIEVCLQLQHESNGGVRLPIETVSTRLLGKVKIRLIGVSSHKLQLLSYFVKDMSITSKIKSIKLLRLDKHTSKELRKYVEYFLPHVFKDTDERTSELQKSDSENLTLRALLKKVESTLRGEVEMSSTCQYDLDTSVILALQSSFLQDAMMLSQSDECCLSTPAKDFAKCLPNLKNLEKIVLIGSILSSETICELARNLKKLPKLKRLDLRLNKQIDDAAFMEVIQSASSCKNLVDLRLSLYKVTLKGYDEVTQCSARDRGGWKRLTKLFLLHGSPTEGFVIFLSKLAMYLMGVEVFNISALNSSDDLSRVAMDGFRDAIKSINSLKKIEIENREDLRKEIKFASKDQKRQGSSIDLPIKSEIFGGSETSPVEEGYVIIPKQPEQNRDEEGRTVKLETTQV